MRNPTKNGEYSEDDGCGKVAVGGALVVLGILGGLGYLAFYGVTEFLARV